jgi:hypothetical protein
MLVNMIRLGMAFFFLMMAIAIGTRHHYLSEEILKRYSDSNLDLGVAFALLMFGWNIARWYAAFSKQRREAKLRESASPELPKAPSRTPREYNPDLDFTKPD